MCTSSVTKLKIHLTVKCFTVYVAVLGCGSVEFGVVLDRPLRTLNSTFRSKAEMKLYSLSCLILHAEKSSPGSAVQRNSSYVVFMCVPTMFIQSGVRSGVEKWMFNSSHALLHRPVSKSGCLYSICI